MPGTHWGTQTVSRLLVNNRSGMRCALPAMTAKEIARSGGARGGGSSPDSDL